MATKSGATEAFARDQPINPWDSSLDKLKEWDPSGAELLLRVGTNPWTSGVLPRKEVELISLALHSACTNLDEAGTRRHIRAALDAGAKRHEFNGVVKGVQLAIAEDAVSADHLVSPEQAVHIAMARQ